MTGNLKDQNVPGRPVIVFDVNETLLDLDTLRPTFDRIFNDPAAMRLWFADLILYSEALTLAGVYVPFTNIGRGLGDHAVPMVTEPVRARAVML